MTAAVKDNIAIAGAPMTLGSPALHDLVPDRSAAVVSRLRSAGARIIGTLTMDALGVSGDGLGLASADTATCANPWSPSHATGGSSSGAAAAVARGLVDIALGTDQGGSVQLPAAWCGVVGLKPTHGRIPTAGVVGLHSRLDHVGPIARTVADAAAAFAALCGPSERDGARLIAAVSREPARPLTGIRIGALVEGFEHEGADSGVTDTAENALHHLKAAGATIILVSASVHPACGRLLPCLTTAGLWRAMSSADEIVRRGYAGRQLAEALVARLRSRAGLLPARVKMVLIFGHLAAARMLAYHRLAISRIAVYRAAYDRLFDRLDCLVLPTTTVPPPIRHSGLEPYARLLGALTRAHLGPLSVNTAPFNMTGHPALSVPAGLRGGLPVGLSIVGPRHAESVLFRVGMAAHGLLPN
jgi:amidase